jgi:hypothetical protein
MERVFFLTSFSSLSLSRQVASYDHWEPCQWDEFVNEDMMARNPDDLSDMVRRSGMTVCAYVYVHIYT